MPDVLVQRKDAPHRPANFAQDAAPKISTPASPQNPSAASTPPPATPKTPALNLPMADYVWQALQQHWQRCQMEQKTPGSSHLWDLIHALSGHDEIWSRWQMDGDGLFEYVDSVFAARSKNKIADWSLFGVDEEDAYTDHYAFLEFSSGWPLIRLRPGHGDALDQAVERERQQPYHFTSDLAEKYKRVNQFERFIGIAGCLQFLNGSRVILLPQKRLATILSVTQPCVSGYTRLAVRDKFLKRVWESSRDKHEAAEYRFDVCKDPRFSDRAQRETTIAFERGCRDYY